MKRKGERKEPSAPTDRRKTFLAGGVIVLAAFAAYYNSFSGPFIFDDTAAIIKNPTIYHLWPPGAVLSPPPDLTVSGRPLLNLSLALNYALDGAHVWGYHVLNLLIHVLAALVLFGLVRRTLLRPALRERFGDGALLLALAVALLWAVHPLQTESVTYIIQRAESLGALFYLLTLYCFVRFVDRPETMDDGREAEIRNDLTSGIRRLSSVLRPPSSVFWALASILCCLAGMASKETMVSAPVMVFLYDRTFVSGSFQKAWKRRSHFYLGLMSTWILLGYLVASTGANRGGSAGFGTSVGWQAYALTQFKAIVHYLRLSIWPHPLVLDYGTGVVTQALEIAPQALVVISLALGAILALKRWPPIGFVGACFFAILAPSSSVVPVATQTMAEHRMYLPLAAVIILAVLGLHAWIGKKGLFLWLGLAAGLGVLTARRNEDYRSKLSIWSAAAKDYPNNVRIHYNLGIALFDAGRPQDAIDEYKKALKLKPDSIDAFNNLGNVLLSIGQAADAITAYQRAVQFEPDRAESHNNLGIALVRAGRVEDGIHELREALRLDPAYAQAHYNLANALVQMGRIKEAIGYFEEAIHLGPDDNEMHNNLAGALIRAGRFEDAIKQYEKALELKPDSAEIQDNLGNVLARQGRLPEAIKHFREALRLSPDSSSAHNNLGYALVQAGQPGAAIEQFEEVVRLTPNSAEAQCALGNTLFQAGRVSEAVRHYQQALRIKPDLTLVYSNLGYALQQLGRNAEALDQFEEAVQLEPGSADAHFDLGNALAQAGRTAEAIRQYEAALRIKPDYALARDQLDRLKTGSAR